MCTGGVRYSGTTTVARRAKFGTYSAQPPASFLADTQGIAYRATDRLRHIRENVTGERRTPSACPKSALFRRPRRVAARQASQGSRPLLPSMSHI